MTYIYYLLFLYFIFTFQMFKYFAPSIVNYLTGDIPTLFTFVS